MTPALFANQTTTCSVPPPGPVNTVGTSTPFGYTLGGGIFATAPTPASYDALAVLYFGLTNDGAVNCNSSVRQALIHNWNNLFGTPCASGAATCTTGLTHAWRDASGSNASMVLSSVLGAFAGPMPPFCDFNPNNPTDVLDYSDSDPVRTPCVMGKDNVCEGSKVNVTPPRFAGDLGVVLPIIVPPYSAAGPVMASDLYPTTPCTSTCGFVAPAKSNQIPASFRCPSGQPPILGFCFMPVTATGDPRCVAQQTVRCVDSVQQLDGRMYNKILVVLTSQLPPIKKSTATYQFGIDASNRLLTGEFFRMHETTAGANNVPDPAHGETGICQEVPFASGDNSSQIGCLVDSDPCSVGSADPNQVAANFFPGLPLPGPPPPAPVPPAVTLTPEPAKSLGFH
jgi:hypothetical protein